MSVAYWESHRDELVESEYQTKLYLALNDGAEFETLNDDYEIVDKFTSQIQRALRNLDSAIKGEEVGRDAVFTALSYIQKNLKSLLREQAERSTPTAEELNEDAHAEALDARMDAAKDARLGL